MEFKKIQTVLFFILLFAVGIVFFHMISPFLFAVFWAAVMATIFYPVYRGLLKILKRPSVSAGVTLLIALILVLIPLLGIFGLIVKQAIGTYAKISDPATIVSIKNTIESFAANPLVAKALENVNVEEKLRSASSMITRNGIEWLKIGSQNTLSAILSLFVMLYSMFFFLKDGPAWLKHLMHLLPFGDKNEELLYDKFASAAKGTLKGTILIGSLQGTLGAIFLAIVGIPSAIFWGLMITIFCIIPAAGSAVVLVPAIIYELVTGRIWQAVILIVGLVVVGLIDNLVRPPLVGKDIEMHPLMILFSTLGGLALFGISGVVIGPIIATFFFAVLEMYENKYKKELDSSRT
ncbi:MAG: AI-2E family transporter [Candidatus Kerfeldbacteria bacterium]|nr:AI-2E family transporter [Candidatus Kerfeldbacteria bacterium]